MHDYADEGGCPLGLVHCDVSPDNVIVSFSGNVALVDFGIVERATEGEKDPDVIKGKLRYIAPERLRGLPMDRRGDIYSLGVLLYELLTGARIYDGLVPEILARAALGNPRRPRSVCAAISAGLEQVVLRAIHASPEARYEEAHVLGAELLLHMPALPEPAARSHELARYVSSLFPDASDIPFDLRRTAHGPRPVPRSYIRMTTPHPPAAGRFAPPLPSAPATEPDPDADDHLSIDLLDDFLDVGPASAGPATLASVASVALESGTHRSVADAGEARADGVAAARAPEPTFPDAEVSSSAPSAWGGPWTPRPRAATLVDVFAVSALKYAPASHEVFPSHRSRGANGAFASSGAAPAAESPVSAPQRVETATARRAARHFDSGLRLCRERRYGAALAEWEMAASLDPAQPIYRANLKKLKARLESER